LSDGQRIVKAGHQKLFDGAKVMTGAPPGAPETQGATPTPMDTAAGSK
jgi:hypothetical protein